MIDDDENDERLPDCKPVLVQCACGKWQLQLHFISGALIYGSETFPSREVAAQVLAERVIEAGIETKKIS